MARLPDLIEFARRARPEDRRDRRPDPLSQPDRAADRARRRAADPHRRRATSALVDVSRQARPTRRTSRWCAATSRPIAKRWCACTSRCRSIDLLDYGSRAHSWTIPAALEAIASAERGVLVLLHRPESAQELRAARASPTSRAPRRKMDLRNYGIGAQILRDLDVGRMRLLARPRKMPSMAGFDLEVTGYEEPSARAPPSSLSGAVATAFAVAQQPGRDYCMPHPQNRSRHARRPHARRHRAVALQCGDRRALLAGALRALAEAGVAESVDHGRDRSRRAGSAARAAADGADRRLRRAGRARRGRSAARPITSRSSPTNRRPACRACSSSSASRSATAS